MLSALICHSLMSGCFNTNDALSSAKAYYALWCINITGTIPSQDKRYMLQMPMPLGISANKTLYSKSVS